MKFVETSRILFNKSDVQLDVELDVDLDVSSRPLDVELDVELDVKLDVKMDVSSRPDMQKRRNTPWSSADQWRALTRPME